MSVPFYSDDAEVIHRQIPDENVPNNTILVPINPEELDRCADWIIEHNFSRIALQFPDSLLFVAVDITQELTDRTQKMNFILADTSYGSCCVDEIAAQHVSADAIIHFGHACLSPTLRLPVLYVFEEFRIDVPDTISAFKKCFPDRNSYVIVYYEVTFDHAIVEIGENLKEYENTVIADLVFPNEECYCEAPLNDDQVRIIRNQRYFILPKAKDLKDYTVFYIGCRTETFINVMLCFNKCKFYQYDTFNKTLTDDSFNRNRFLRQRNYYIERTRDARIIGILVGTLGVSNYISSIKRLREAIAVSNKKSYVLVIGKRNIAKLANFAEIEVFVNVACLESTLVDCSGFFQPIITPYELEIALNIREWTDDFITNFAELLPDGDYHVPLSEMKPETDVSLITGKTRSLGLCDTSNETTDESTAIVQRDEMAISEIHCQAAGEFLTQRSWKGLEQNLGQTEVADIQQGSKGIASKYDDEKDGEN